MPSLVKEDSQDPTAAPPPYKQAAVRPTTNKLPSTSTLKTNEKRKSHQSTSSTTTKTQKRKKKDPNEPKYARTAYNFYTKDARPKIIAAGVKEVNSELGTQWRAMSAVERLPYERMASDDKRRYAEEKAAYETMKNSLTQGTTTKVVDGGGKTPQLSSTAKAGEKQQRNTLKHHFGVVDNAAKVNMKNTANNNNVKSSPSQKSIESVEVDLLIDLTTDEDDKDYTDAKALNKTGNKENNSATKSVKVGKGVIGNPTRLFNDKLSKSKEEEAVTPKTAVRAGSYIAVVTKKEDDNDVLGRGEGGERVNEEKDSSGGVNGHVEVNKESGAQRTVETKLGQNEDNADTIQVDINQATAQLELKSPDDDHDDDDDDETASKQSFDLLSECCADDETPVAGNASNAKKSSSDNLLSKLTLVPLTRDECTSALLIKGCPIEQPSYLLPIPKEDLNHFRETIVLTEKLDTKSHTISSNKIVLGRSKATGIKSTFISRQLCSLEIGEVAEATITVLKESKDHVIFHNGMSLNKSSGFKLVLKDQDILSLYGPVDFAYRIQLSL